MGLKHQQQMNEVPMSGKAEGYFNGLRLKVAEFFFCRMGSTNFDLERIKLWRCPMPQICRLVASDFHIPLMLLIMMMMMIIMMIPLIIIMISKRPQYVWGVRPPVLVVEDLKIAMEAMAHQNVPSMHSRRCLGQSWMAMDRGRWIYPLRYPWIVIYRVFHGDFPLQTATNDQRINLPTS